MLICVSIQEEGDPRQAKATGVGGGGDMAEREEGREEREGGREKRGKRREKREGGRGEDEGEAMDEDQCMTDLERNSQSEEEGETKRQKLMIESSTSPSR